MQAVFETMLKVSCIQDHVLVIGETGTGKEVVSRAIHELGPRRNKPFFPLDCCALMPSLIETELFGYVRGAFTGAVNSKRGLFESAQAGTVFLDEIAELPVNLQGKLLRVMQEGQIRPVGGTGWIKVNARIIAATNCDLEAAVRKGTFRKDLFFRLNVLTVHLPPLRERMNDIPLIANHILDKYCKDKCERPELTDEAVDWLITYGWPGNVRELENCMRSVLAFSSGPLITVRDLPLNIQRSANLFPELSDQSDELVPLQELERRAIFRAMDRAHGDKVLAARLLGIGKTTLYRKLNSYRYSSTQESQTLGGMIGRY